MASQKITACIFGGGPNNVKRSTLKSIEVLVTNQLVKTLETPPSSYGELMIATQA